MRYVSPCESLRKLDDALLTWALNWWLQSNVDSLQFIIQCGGGQVSWESDAAPFAEADESITHQIMDRPSQRHQFLSREYVQPQWIYDSFNARVLLPTAEYLPGVVLPPHLSPFVNLDRAAYVPERAIEIKNIRAQILAGKPIDAKQADGMEQADDDEEDEEEADVDEDEDEAEAEARFQRELEAEAAGVAFSATQQTKSAASAKEAKKLKKQQALEREKAAKAESDRLASIMIPTKKTRRLYQRVKVAEKRKEDRTQRLINKRDALKQKKPKQ